MIKTVEFIQNYNFIKIPTPKFVLGWWVLCYLNEHERQDLLTKISNSLEEDGRVIFNEPILEAHEQKER